MLTACGHPQGVRGWGSCGRMWTGGRRGSKTRFSCGFQMDDP